MDVAFNKVNGKINSNIYKILVDDRKLSKTAFTVFHKYMMKKHDIQG